MYNTNPISVILTVNQQPIVKSNPAQISQVGEYHPLRWLNSTTVAYNFQLSNHCRQCFIWSKLLSLELIQSCETCVLPSLLVLRIPYVLYGNLLCTQVDVYPQEYLTVNYSISRLITVVTASIRYSIINANDNITWSEPY